MAFQTYDTCLKGSYNFIGYFETQALKKIQPLVAQYGQKFQPTSKHQYDECKTGLNISAIL